MKLRIRLYRQRIIRIKKSMKFKSYRVLGLKKNIGLKR